MRVKNNKALRGSARRVAVSATPALPAATPFLGRPIFRGGAANTVAAAVAGILYGSSGAAWAQQAQEAAPASAPTNANLQEVVVTANAEQGVKKLDASYNVVTVDLAEIKQVNPKSSADLLKISPGIWPESSGGQTGANVEVAGFPSGGDAPFFTQMIQGLPMYGMPNLSFMDSTSFYRIDDTMDRFEIVQGGPSAIFGPAQMGATANIILRTGSATPTGSVGVTYGDEGLWRTDLFYGFPIADGWYGSVGGFYRVSDGVRPPSFPSDQGGQFTATLKHDLDNGSLTVWGRAIDDKNQFIVPVPVIQNAAGTSFSDYPTFCALKCSYGSLNIQNVNVPNPAGGFETADLSNGRGTNMYFGGVDWNEKFGAWSLLNNFMINGGGLDTNALFSGPNPQPLSYYLYGCNTAQPTGYCNGTTPTPQAGSPGLGLPANYNISATYAGTGQPVPLNQSVVQQGWWYIQKSLSNLVDEFRASREIFAGNTLTGGVYFAKYSDNDNWSLGNQMLMANQPNTNAIVLNYLSGNSNCKSPGVTTGGVHVCNLTSTQGFVNDNGNFNILEHGNAQNIAGYLVDSWRVGGFLIDGGARVENINARQRTCNRSNVQMGSDFDLWDNAVPLCNGTWNYEHYVKTMPTFTIGVNYEFSDHFSAYARWNNGVHYNDFDNGIRDASTATPPGFLPLQTVQNYEVGIKYQGSFAYVDLSAYHRVFDGLSYQEATSTGVPLGIYSTFGALTKGVDLTATLTPFHGLNISLIGDYMDGHYQNQVGASCFTNLSGQQQCESVDGAPLQRQPKYHLQVTPAYTTPAPWGDATVWLTYEYIGQRYEDEFGEQPLGIANMFSAGFVADFGNSWQFRVQGTNLTNEIALTEGNARQAGKATGIDGVLMARPMEGREVSFSIYYKW
jgi:outer membrane cobalamin receptor